MAKYIPLDVLVEELERRKHRNLLNEGAFEEDIDILSFLDTLEVKEVDLEKAIDDYIYTHDGRKRLALELDWKCCNLTLKGGDEIIKFAQHFFELGVNTSNPLTWEDIKLIWTIGDEIPYMPEEEFFKELLKQFKAQKGK